ncbi:hypothetical protein F4778DRAFT_780026 [Xylariomycetidae sp. FL2044]|nr:hypothetical protein F4778DRAFT_780026 [Xylariomycetidae sp. FL2044]
MNRWRDYKLPVEDVWEDRTWWRYDGYYQMPDPDPEDKLGLDWYGVRQPEEGLYLQQKGE